jgi:hypothetical protein
MIHEFISKAPSSLAGLFLGDAADSPAQAVSRAGDWTRALLPQCSMLAESMLIESDEDDDGSGEIAFSVDVVEIGADKTTHPVGALQGKLLGHKITELAMSVQSNPLPDLRLTARLVAREIKECKARLRGRSVVLDQAEAWAESFEGTLSEPAVLAELSLIVGDDLSSTSLADPESYNPAVTELMRGAAAGAVAWVVTVGVMVDEVGVMRLFGMARLRGM